MNPPIHTHRILNLGAGVQSSTLYCMAVKGLLQFDCAIFADTQEEPGEVYRHLEYLKTLGGPVIHVVTQGKLGEDLIRGTNSKGQQKRGGRFASIPAFTAMRDGEKLGIVRRQCTSEYKIKPIERFIRQSIFAIPFGGRVTKNIRCLHFFEISLDEVARSTRIKANCQDKWRTVLFPLIEMQMTRADCLRWLAANGFAKPPRSACVFCPFKRDSEWLRLRQDDPAGWARAVEIDNAIREDGVACNQKMRQKLYLHSSCIPLSEVHLNDEDRGQLGFWQECQGMCGN